MAAAFTFMLGGDVVIFTAALALMLGLGVLEGAGLGGFDPDLDVDGGGGPLDWLGVGRVPFLVFLIALLAAFGIIGLVGQQVAAAVTGATLPPLAAIPAALLLALPATAVATRLLARVLPRDESSAVHVDELVGRRGVLVTGTARPGDPARARVADRHGHPHFVMVEPAEPGDAIAEGDRILLVGRLASGFRAVSVDPPSLSLDPES